MMENRSFDNLLGYLSMAPYSNRGKVDGIQNDDAWKDQYANVYQGIKYRPFPLDDPYHAMDGDPPHERDPIALQMGAAVNGKFPLNGFVANYAQATEHPTITQDHLPPVMGYFSADQAPVTDFFARNFAICDNWFASLPAGTQPNRLMAMSGESNIDINHVPIPSQKLVYDWLDERQIPWRVYHEGMPFFALMPHWIPDILFDKNFRDLDQLSRDIENIDSASEEPFPQVIFIEPTYTDATHIGPSSDDHAPSAIKGGQEFLSTVYRKIAIEDPEFWKGVVMIVTYDEHGGFFDHVSPPAIQTTAPPGITYRNFETLGVRVPAFVISPFVEKQYVHKGLLDHTSILKFIAQKFDKRGSYSDSVDKRAVGSVLDVLTGSNPQQEAPAMLSLDPYLQKEKTPNVGYTPTSNPDTVIQKGFQDALHTVKNTNNPKGKFADLLAVFPTQPHVI